jgi:hypothetical protein
MDAEIPSTAKATSSAPPSTKSTSNSAPATAHVSDSSISDLRFETMSTNPRFAPFPKWQFSALTGLIPFISLIANISSVFSLYRQHHLFSK